MITLDEAIERELNIAHEGSDCWKHCSNTKKHCKDCMAEHEQIAEWLEELKELRITVSELQRELQATGALLDERDKETRNKAIDDFVEELKDYFVIPHDVRVIEMKAEQLKAECKNCRRWTCLECPYADI